MSKTRPKGVMEVKGKAMRGRDQRRQRMGPVEAGRVTERLRPLGCLWLLGMALLVLGGTPAWAQRPKESLPPPPKRESLQNPSPRDPHPRELEGMSPLERQRLIRRLDRPLPPPPRVQERWRSFEQLPPQEKDRLKGRFQEWRSLPPEQRQDLREKMDRWRQLPAQDRQQLRQRYEQWRSLGPEEQGRLREKIKQWESLSPKEKEEIRRRFKSP